MNVQRTSPGGFTVEFESAQELQDEHRANLSFGALRLLTTETVALHAVLEVTLRGPWGAEVAVKATVVGTLPDGIALAIDGNTDGLLGQLLARETHEHEEPPEKRQTAWDRLRALSQMEKILLAVKAEQTERALLVQDNDPRVLLSLLRNPRLTVDEVVRLARSAHLTYQIAEVIMKAPQWMANLDVRLGLIHNPKTPPAFSLRILPTLPDAELKAIARGGSSMALKQAALRRLQGKP